jgi:hypothetical protein
MTCALYNPDFTSGHALIELQVLGGHDGVERAREGEQWRQWCEGCKALIWRL